MGLNSVRTTCPQEVFLKENEQQLIKAAFLPTLGSSFLMLTFIVVWCFMPLVIALSPKPEDPWRVSPWAGVLVDGMNALVNGAVLAFALRTWKAFPASGEEAARLGVAGLRWQHYAKMLLAANGLAIASFLALGALSVWGFSSKPEVPHNFVTISRWVHGGAAAMLLASGALCGRALTDAFPKFPPVLK